MLAPRLLAARQSISIACGASEMANQLVPKFVFASLLICARISYTPALFLNSTYVTIVVRLVANALKMLCAFPLVIGTLFGSK